MLGLGPFPRGLTRSQVAGVATELPSGVFLPLARSDEKQRAPRGGASLALLVLPPAPRLTDSSPRGCGRGWDLPGPRLSMTMTVSLRLSEQSPQAVVAMRGKASAP